MHWVKVDLTEVAPEDQEREFTSFVWELTKQKEGEEYQQARFERKAVGVISNPPGFVAQVDWARCRVCRNEDLTVKGLCRKCRGPLL